MIHIYDAIPQYLHDLANRAGSHPGQSSPSKEEKKMCTANELMARIEMLIVLAELHEERKLDVPCEVLAAMDFCGPALMTNARKELKLSGLGMAKLLLDQRAKLFTANGMTPPDVGPIGKLVDILAEALGEKPNGAKDAAPADETKQANVADPLAQVIDALRGGADEVHVFVVGKDEAPKA